MNANGNDLHSAVEALLREDRIPHIWCPGCGLGSVLHSLLTALIKSGLDLDRVAVVSGIGCTGRAAGYIKLDSFHTTHGRAVPFATGLKLANPDLKVVVFSGDGDLAAIGGNHLIHAARRNMDLTVICVNNFNYGMTGGQVGPTTPIAGRTSTSPYGNGEFPFNLPRLAAAAGAVYVARWISLDARRLEKEEEQAAHRFGADGILSGHERDQAWRGPRRGGNRTQWADRGGQVCGYRSPHVLGDAGRDSGQDIRLQIREGIGRGESPLTDPMIPGGGHLAGRR